MATKQLIENAVKLLKIYKRTQDEELWDMALSLLDTALELQGPHIEIPGSTIGPMLPRMEKLIPQGVFVYACPMETDSNWTNTKNSDRITITNVNTKDKT